MIAPHKISYQASQKSVIETAKEVVSTLDLAERVSGPGVRRGREIHLLCPLHDDHDPSLRVSSKNGLWYCDPCGIGGDVIELARLVWGYEKHEAAMAAAQLLHEFGYEIPQRPPSWFARQERQQPARNALEEAKVLHMQRRVFRIFLPLIQEILDEDERREEVRYLWDAAGEIAVFILAGRSS